MYYYDVALPLALENNYTYSHSEKLKPGMRVIVKLRNVYYTGIIWQETNEISKKIKYFPVTEVIDKTPLIPQSILKLASWASEYYAAPLGQCLFAMVPRALDVNVILKCRLLEGREDVNSDSKTQRILAKLDDQLWISLKDLKKELKMPGFFPLIEELEEKKLIEVQRTFDKKIKKKVVNYVINNHLENYDLLSPRQNELYKFICGAGNEMPLSIIARDYSYALVKALRQKGLISIEPREVMPVNDLMPGRSQRPEITLSGEQRTAVQEISAAGQAEKFKAFLLYGITGSGKTEVYIRAIEKVLTAGKTALMLVPEISLTPQMVDRFYSAFGENIAILHSRLNDRQRWQQWQDIRKGESHIVIGARSAVFAPLANLGIIIVDEEHENSYKQDSAPRYNGRDLAVMRAWQEKAVIVLGSATPSLESWHNAQSGKYELLTLSKRPGDVKLPEVQIINMQDNKDAKNIFSEQLLNLIEDRLKKKQQIILFQNRRGHSSFIQCINCGLLLKCPNCDISFNYHSFSDTLLCHYCGLRQKVPRKCPDCGSFLFNYGAPGTQQIEEQLKIVFPQARILRMDSDTTTKSNSFQVMFERMREGSVDILLGTQMISKGLDFPNVTLVGVISADVGLSFPDFRAGEDTFQLLTQVAGRSGRGELKGEVVIQTYNPSHYAITSAMRQDFPAFAKIELEFREALHYSPFYRLARLLFTSENEAYLQKFLEQCNPIFSQITNTFKPGDIFLIGPSPAPLAKIKNKYRFHLFMKARNNQVVNLAVNQIRKGIKLPASIKLSIDIDPRNML